MSYMHEQVGRCDPGRLARWAKKRRVTRCLFNFFFGIESEIPLCCVIEYTIRNAGHPIKSFCVGNNACHANFAHCWFHRRYEHFHVVPRDYVTSSML